MRYYRVSWTDKDGARHLSDPLSTWLDAMSYRAELIITGAVPAPCYATIKVY